MRRKRTNETFRDFGQAIDDLYRKAYPDIREYIKESSLKTFLDNCSEDSEFRYAVKRIRPKTLQDAITAAMRSVLDLEKTLENIMLEQTDAQCTPFLKPSEMRMPTNQHSR